MKKKISVIIIGLAFAYGLLFISGYDWFLKGIGVIYLTGHDTAFLDDYRYFDNRAVPAPEVAQPWPDHEQFNQLEVSEALEAYHKKTKSVAFLVIKNDSLLYEKYYKGYGSSSKSNSFSVAKSMVSALLGKAVMDGYVKSLDQKVIDFVPELKGPYAQQVTMGDLSAMASGMKWDEKYYNPFSVTAAAYFVNDLTPLILDQPIIDEPGKSFRYLSGATQILGIALTRAVKKTLSDYLSESFWKPMGAEQEALWQLDSATNGMEKAYCCFATNARDFARFGKLYKNHGRWNNTQLLDSTFIAKSIQPRFEASPEYGYGWWLETYKDHKVFMERGHLGQYVIVFPELDLIVVRLGELKGNRSAGNPYTEDIYIYMDAALEMAENVTENKSS
ncbi:MAG: serine hydrolase domain-containing protein [Flavobacteriaceae bacterium]